MKEPVTVGLSASAHAHLTALESAGFFARMNDAYRFAIALGLSHESFDNSERNRRTIFNVGSLDPDRSIYEAVAALRTRTDEPVYRTAERYAEWGVEEIIRLRASGDIDFGTLLKEAERLAE
jgi:hypothetical protein